MFFEIFSYLRCDFIFDLCFLFCFFTEKTAISFEIKYDEFIKINIKFKENKKKKKKQKKKKK